MQQENTSLALVQNTLTEFDKVAAGLADLETKYKDVVYPVATTKGMDDAKAARVAIREPRYQVDRAAKAAKAPLNALKKNIDERAEQITEALFALETPIDQQIKLEEARREEEKRVKAEAEAKRVADLRARIEAIAATPARLAGESSVKIGEALANLNAIEIDASFEEFTPHAADAKDTAVSTLISLQQKAAAQEAEQEAFRQAQAELARQQAAAAAEAAKLAAERAEIEAARAKAEADALTARQAAEAEAAALRKKLDDEAAAAAAERLRLATEADRAREAEVKKIADFNKTRQDAFEAERLAEQQKLQAARDQLAAERRAHQEELEAVRRAAELVVAPATEAAVHPNGAPKFSDTVFKDNGEPIMLNADGSRSVFCDLNDDMDDAGAATAGTPARTRPSAEEIVAILAARFQEDDDVIVEWIMAAAEELSGVAA